MRDEMDGRLWDAHGRQFSDDLHHLSTAAAAALARLSRAAVKAAWQGSTAAQRRPGQA